MSKIEIKIHDTYLEMPTEYPKTLKHLLESALKLQESVKEILKNNKQAYDGILNRGKTQGTMLTDFEVDFYHNYEELQYLVDKSEK